MYVSFDGNLKEKWTIQPFSYETYLWLFTGIEYFYINAL